MSLVAQNFGLPVMRKPKMLGFLSIGSPKCWATEQKENKGYAKLTIGSPSFVRKDIYVCKTSGILMLLVKPNRYLANLGLPIVTKLDQLFSYCSVAQDVGLPIHKKPKCLGYLRYVAQKCGLLCSLLSGYRDKTCDVIQFREVRVPRRRLVFSVPYVSTRTSKVVLRG